MTNLERIRKQLSAARRKKVATRAAQLIAEEMTLQELRRARKLTQDSREPAPGYDSNVHSPPAMVRSIGIVISVCGSSRSGSRPNTTRSASFPGSIDPFSFSSYDA